jgi:hypothetical protein
VLQRLQGSLGCVHSLLLPSLLFVLFGGGGGGGGVVVVVCVGGGGGVGGGGDGFVGLCGSCHISSGTIPSINGVITFGGVGVAVGGGAADVLGCCC